MSARCCFFGLAMLFSILGEGTIRAQDGEAFAAYFADLRANGLFRVAEEYGLARFEDPDLSPADRALIAVELSRAFASHAAEASSFKEAQELWSRANEALQPLLADPQHPRWIVVRARQATLLADRAATEFWQSRLSPDSVAQQTTATSATQRALTDLRAASEAFRNWSQKPVRANNGATRPASPAARRGLGDLSAVDARRVGDELESVATRMNLNLAQLLPDGPDRAAALIDAEESATALGKQSRSEFVWPARLARVEAIRLQGDSNKAVSLAKSLKTPDLPPQFLDAVIAEQARSELAREQFADAMQIILDHGQVRSGLSPELRAINVECLLASIEKMRTPPASSKTSPQERAAVEEGLWQQIEVQRQLISGPWRGSVERLVARAIQTREYGAELADLVRGGLRAAETQDWPAAAKAYEQAAAHAERQGKLELAAEFAYTRASIAIETGNLAEAGQLLTEFQTRFPSDSRGADAQLLAAWTFGQRLEREPTAALRAEYTKQLRTLIAKYPEHPARVEAEWALAVDAIRHEEWTTAISFVEAIPNDHARATEAAAQWPFCYEQVLSTTGDLSQRKEWEQRASQALSVQLARWPKPPSGWTLEQAESGLRWTRVLLALTTRRYADSDTLLQQVVHSRDLAEREAARDGSPLAPGWAALMPMIQQLRIVSLAGRGRMGEAELLLRQVTTAEPAELLAILSGLSDLSRSLDKESRRDLGRVQLTVAGRLDRQRSMLSPEIVAQLDDCLAAAYTATGDLPEAIAIYEAHLKTRPRDRALLETIGQLSIERGQPENLQRAKMVYRQLEGFDPAGSPAWLKNRLEVARLCHRLGEQKECQKLLKVTRILYPDLGGTALKTDFEALEMEVGP